MDELKSILAAVIGLRPLSQSELEAAEIVTGVTNLFKAIAMAGPESSARAAITLAQLGHDAAEELEKVEDKETQRVNLILVEMLKQTSDNVRKVAIAHVGLKCDGNCAECTDGPQREDGDTDDKTDSPCFRPGDKEPWS